MLQAPEPLRRGKVRDIYALPGHPDKWLVIASDRISIFDVVMDDLIPGRGKILTAMTNFWLQLPVIAGIAPNHVVPFEPDELPEWARDLAERATIVRVADVQPVEWIVRSHLVGSAWREYQQHGTMHGMNLPPGMLECQELPEPVVTPSTKAFAGEHDRNITFNDAVAIVGRTAAERARQLCLRAYHAAEAYAREQGVVLLDTKFELGELDGELAFCDEVLTPDSSRFVLVEDCVPGRAPEAIDKEYLRQWGRSIGWTGDSPPPALPGYVVRNTVRLYRAVCRRITGSSPA